MLSLSSLLNPDPSGPPINRFPPSPASSSSPTTSIPDESGLPEPTMPKQKIPKSAALLPAGRPKGAINFLPHERLDEASQRLVRKFRVHRLGIIQHHARHIPYNSGKKDFFEKTGRESFEVFQYDFKIPGDETDYTIMWDYNVGLVRMTPFFKCCKYPKTTPAKMLNLNPGLKEITHSITGGSIMAQGYWMPFQCAKAVCATFCHHIAGALIPIFGPDFPSLCTPSESPDYGRMVIDPEIVHRCTRDAEHFRRVYSNAITSSGSGRLSPPRDRRPMYRNSYVDSPKHMSNTHRHHPVRKTIVSHAGYDSPYATDTDSDLSPVAAEHRVTAEHRSMAPRDRYFSSIPPPHPHPPPLGAPPRYASSGWTPANVPPPPPPPPPYSEAPGPSPWLSAVPRFTTADHLPPYQPSPRHHHHHHHNHHPTQYYRPPGRGGTKRSAEQIEAEERESEYESDRIGGRHCIELPANRNKSSTSTATTTATSTATNTPALRGGSIAHDKPPGCDTPIPGADKNAALLLMNLSVRDFRCGTKSKPPAAAAVVSETNSPCDGEFPRIKRIRANSM
ncbi:hypothetical protein GGR53DRAFT_528923 [Hypoxylon sp. FL1150]|nr:hypothetical protein GGR53DRAFT_528923 [Hypoxylon sp. FL1150]